MKYEKNKELATLITLVNTNHIGKLETFSNIFESFQKKFYEIYGRNNSLQEFKNGPNYLLNYVYNDKTYRAKTIHLNYLIDRVLYPRLEIMLNCSVDDPIDGSNEKIVDYDSIYNATNLIYKQDNGLPACIKNIEIFINSIMTVEKLEKIYFIFYNSKYLRYDIAAIYKTVEKNQFIDNYRCICITFDPSFEHND